MVSEKDVQNGTVFATEVGDVFVKINDQYCAYVCNLNKVMTDYSLLLPLLENINVSVVGRLDVVAQANKQQVH